ncbi:MAG: T9SS type A sorting domain-containing protein, partial [Bacteroidaceae bacterium]|nr:T9SS type A sorting domain-containing protein [Bacteroidaceae bacterium]
SKVNADITIRNRKISIISDEPAQRLEITDMQGRTLFHENVISNNISVSSDMRGLYMVSVWFANGEKLAKKVMMY